MTQIAVLIAKAKEASNHSYSPYSKFKVGAALEDSEGNIFSGCNVENLSFPAGICAEQTAISKAVSEAGNGLKIKTLVVYTSTDQITTPCGICRQVISEFALQDTMILCVCDSKEVLETSFSQLFPQATVIDNLRKD